MPSGIYIRTKKIRKNIGKASKGRHTLSWYINKYGEKRGTTKYKKRSILQTQIATAQDHSFHRNKTYEEIHGVVKAKKLKEQLRIAHTGTTQSDKTKKKRSEKLKGRVFSANTINKMSSTRKIKILNGGITISSRVGRGKGGYKKDIGHHIRSSYEHYFAKLLKVNNIKYQYESKRFKVNVDNEERAFIPDFLVNVVFYEIKNSFNVNNEIFNKKLSSFRKKYPHETLHVIVGNDNWKVQNIEDVMDNQKDLVKILVKLKPLAVVKG